MTRRSGKGPGLTVRVSHEATRLSREHVAAAFERLVPVHERQTRLSRAEGNKPETDVRRGADDRSDCNSSVDEVADVARVAPMIRRR
jgi:hypothetical protein